MSLENKIRDWKGKVFNSKLGKALVGGSLLLALSGCGNEKSAQLPLIMPPCINIDVPAPTAPEPVTVPVFIDNPIPYPEYITVPINNPIPYPEYVTVPVFSSFPVIIDNPFPVTCPVYVEVPTAPKNQPPMLVKSMPNFSDGVEDTSYQIYLADYIYDSDTPRLHYEIAKNSSASSVSTRFDGDYLILTPAKDWNGAVALKVRAWDGQSYLDSNEFNVTFAPVNDPPFLKKELKYITFNEDGTYTIDLSQIFGDVDSVLRYEVKFSSTDISAIITGTTMKIVPKPYTKGRFNMLLSAYDEEYSVNATATVDIKHINHPPTFTQPPNMIMDDTGSATLDVNKYIADVDGDKLECYFGSWPGSFNVSIANCVATASPINKFVGTGTASICTTDEIAQVCRTLTLESRVCYNDAEIPMQNTSKINITRNEDTTAVHNLLEDICSPSGSLTFTITTPSPNINASISGSNLTASSKVLDYNGTDQIGVRACNPAGCIDTVVYLLTVAVNDPPVLITPLPDFTNDEFIQTHQIYLTNSFKDVDSTLTFSYEDPGNYFNVSIVNGVASVTPKDYNFTSASLKFKASDGQYEVSDWVTIAYTYGCTTTNNYFSQQPDGSWKGPILSRFYTTYDGIPVVKGDTISTTVTGIACWYSGNCAGPNQTTNTWGAWAEIICNGTVYGPFYIGSSYSAKLDYLPASVTCKFVPVFPDGSSVSSCNGDLRPDNIQYYTLTGTVRH